jgi:hypothetical protein
MDPFPHCLDKLKQIHSFNLIGDDGVTDRLRLEKHGSSPKSYSYLTRDFQVTTGETWNLSKSTRILQEISFGYSFVMARMLVYALTNECSSMRGENAPKIQGATFRLPSLFFAATNW